MTTGRVALLNRLSLFGIRQSFPIHDAPSMASLLSKDWRRVPLIKHVSYFAELDLRDGQKQNPRFRKEETASFPGTAFRVNIFCLMTRAVTELGITISVINISSRAYLIKSRYRSIRQGDLNRRMSDFVW
jgi:hypothetical protein